MFNNVDAWNSVNLTFKNGVTAHFETSFDVPYFPNTPDAIIFGSKGFIASYDFNRQEKAEIHIYKDEDRKNDLVEEIKVPFDVNGFEYQVIDATECIINGKIQSDIHSFEHSVAICEMMDIIRNDWGFKYPFEK